MSGAAQQKPPLQAWLLARLALSLLGRASVIQLAANGAAAIFIIGVLGWIGTTFGRIDIPGMPSLGWAYIWPIVAILFAMVALHAMFTRLAVSLLLDGPTGFRAAIKASLPPLPAMFALAAMSAPPVLALACLFAVPGLWLFGRVATAPAALLAEETGPIQAVRLGAAYSEGYVWQAVVPWTVVATAWLLSQFAIIGLLTRSDVWALGTIAHAVSLTFFLAWQAIYFVLVYLKLRKLTD